jgi:hypothetical protein
LNGFHESELHSGNNTFLDRPWKKTESHEHTELISSLTCKHRDSALQSNSVTSGLSSIMTTSTNIEHETDTRITVNCLINSTLIPECFMWNIRQKRRRVSQPVSIYLKHGNKNPNTVIIVISRSNFLPLFVKQENEKTFLCWTSCDKRSTSNLEE